MRKKNIFLNFAPDFVHPQPFTGDSVGSVGSAESEPPEKFRQRRFQSFGNLFDIHQRNISHSALDSAVVCPVKAAALRRLFLIDFLFLADATDGAAKPGANIDGH